MKRFIYDSKQQRMVKTGDFVPFPNIIKIPVSFNDNLALTNYFKSAEGIIRYKLKSIIVHLGSSLNYGHYISLIKHKNVWFKYNDDIVDVRNCSTFRSYFNLYF